MRLRAKVARGMLHEPPMLRLRTVFAFLFAFATYASTTRSAHAQLAQPIQLTANYPRRTHTWRVPAPQSSDPTAGNAGINRADCDSEEVWQFSFVIPLAVSYSSLEIWAS